MHIPCGWLVDNSNNMRFCETTHYCDSSTHH